LRYDIYIYMSLGFERLIKQTDLESFKIWCWRRMEMINWTDRVRNEEILQIQGEKYPT